MSEEDTRQFSGSSKFEERLFSELGAIRGGIAEFGCDIAEIRGDIAEIRRDITEIRADIAKLDIRLTAVENRLTMLEERVDARLLETRPIWEAVQASIARLDDKFDTVIQDLYEVKTDIRVHGKLLKEHERRLNPERS